MNSEKLTFDLPPNFGDNDTVSMISYRLWKFHGQSLRTANQKAIAWLHPEDYIKAEMSFYNSPISAIYVPPIADIKYFPVGNDKVIPSNQAKKGIMEIEGVELKSDFGVAF